MLELGGINGHVDASTEQMSTAEPKLKAECCDFKDGSTRVQIKLFLDGEELATFTVPRRHAAIVVSRINGCNQEKS